MIPADRLRVLAREAIERGREEWQRRQATEALEEADLTEEERLAARVIQQILHRAEVEARIGRRQAIVMMITDDDYDRPSHDRRGSFCRHEWLRGACRTVYNRCAIADLKPTLDSCYDSSTDRWNFYLVIHW